MGMSVPELTESQNPRQMIDFPVSCAEPFLETSRQEILIVGNGKLSGGGLVDCSRIA
jgi:hypothetical protein